MQTFQRRNSPVFCKNIIFTSVHACTSSSGESRARMDRARVRSIVGSILSAFCSRIHGYFSTARPSTYSTDRRIENYIKFFALLSFFFSFSVCFGRSRCVQHRNKVNLQGSSVWTNGESEQLERRNRTFRDCRIVSYSDQFANFFFNFFLPSVT